MVSSLRDKETPLALPLPSLIGKYELQEYLGGGMSEVYRARDTVIGRIVAIKILTDAGCADTDTKARFLQEARLAGNIQHDNVISIYDFGEDDRKRPFMVMEFLRGVNLRHAIRDGKLGDLCAKLRIALQVARSLGYIHTLGIVHRDIKPENIHLTTSGVVKLMDFGIAKTQGMSMTRTGYVMGTPYYMAPEQVLGENIGPAVDIYAFGVLFFELLAGVRPITGDAIERIFYAILNEPLNLEPLRGSVPQPVCDLVARCTAKKAADRPANFEVVTAEIERILADLEAPAGLGTNVATAVQPPSVPQPSVQQTPAPLPSAAQPAAKPFAPKAWMAVVLGVALLIAIGVLVKMMLAPAHRTEPPPTPTSTSGTTPANPGPAAVAPAGMVLVPAGPFQYGEHNEPKTLDAYYIDKTTVTNAEYEKFCQETNHERPKDFPADKPDYPVVNVTIGDARAFAAWAHKRLPSAQEWEKAARGEDGRLFPWGNKRDAGLANVADNPTQGQHQLMPAESFPQGASPYGALNMVGNVFELVDEKVEPLEGDRATFKKLLKPPPTRDEPWYSIRGVSYRFKLAGKTDPAKFDYGGAWDYTAVPARWHDKDIGFRCVK